MLTVLRHRNFGLLWWAGLISLGGDWALITALPYYVYTQTGSTLASGAMLVSTVLPGLLFGSVAGVFVDRWNRQHTMIITNIGRGLLLLLMLFVKSPDQIWIVYVVSFFQSLIGQFFSPAESALLPLLVDKKHVLAANSLNAINDNVARLVGPVLGGVLVGSFGLQGVILVDSASFILAGLIIAFISVPHVPVDSDSPETKQAIAAWTQVWRDWTDGLRLIRRERVVNAVFIVAAIAMLADSVVSTLLAPFVSSILGGNAEAFGWLLTMRGLGGLAGGFLIGQLSLIIPANRLLAGSLAIVGALSLLMYNVPDLNLAFVLTTCMGVIVVGWLVSQQTLIQTTVMDQYRGRVFGALGTTSALLMLVGSSVSGWLGDIVGVLLLLNVSGSLYIFAGVVALLLLRPREAQPALASHNPITRNDSDEPPRLAQ